MPCSCIAATYESETVAAMPSKPGNPMWPAGSWIVLPLRSVSALDPDADEVGERLAGVRLDFRSLGRVGTEDGRNVGRDVLEHCVRGCHLADVAASPGVRHPRRRGVVAVRG